MSLRCPRTPFPLVEAGAMVLEASSLAFAEPSATPATATGARDEAVFRDAALLTEAVLRVPLPEGPRTNDGSPASRTGSAGKPGAPARSCGSARRTGWVQLLNATRTRQK